MTQVSDDNKAKALKMWQEVLNNRNFAVIQELNSPDYKFNGTPMTPAEVEDFVNYIYATAPGYHFVIDYAVSEGATVALYWTINLPQGNKLPQTNGSAAYVIGANFLTFAGGQIISNDQAGGNFQSGTLGDVVLAPDFRIVLTCLDRENWRPAASRNSALT